MDEDGRGREVDAMDGMGAPEFLRGSSGDAKADGALLATGMNAAATISD